MSDKKRQVRGTFTGGLQDINDFYEALKLGAEAAGWEETFIETKPFGDVGPLNKITFGFTEL